MLQALWSVEIMSPSGGIGIGVVMFQMRRVFGDFFETGLILGGSGEYIYSGTYSIENHVLTGAVEVTYYAGEPYPIFEPHRKFRLEIAGELDRHVDRDVMEISGQRADLPDRPLRLRLTRRAELS